MLPLLLLHRFACVINRLAAGIGAATRRAAAVAVNRAVHKVKVECCIVTRSAMRLTSPSNQIFGPSKFCKMILFRVKKELRAVTAPTPS